METALLPDIDYLFSRYSVSRSQVDGAKIREDIELYVPEVVKYYGYPEMNSFKELVDYHDDVTSPLRDLLINNDFIVITADQQLPWSLEHFLALLKRTSLRGLRVVPAIHSGDFVYSNNTKDRARFLLKDGEFTMFQPEWEGSHRFDDYIHLLALARDQVQVNMSVIRSYFGGSSYTLPPLYFTKEEDIVYSLVERHMNESCVVLFGLNDEGEYIHEGIERIRTVTIRDEDGDIVQKNAVELNCTTDYMSFSRTGNIFTFTLYSVYEYTRPYDGSDRRSSIKIEFTDHKFATKEEQYSYWYYYLYENFDVLYQNELIGNEWLFEIPARHGCADTGAEILCLVSDEQLESTDEFTVLSVKQGPENLYFHNISIINA